MRCTGAMNHGMLIATTRATMISSPTASSVRLRLVMVGTLSTLSEIEPSAKPAADAVANDYSTARIVGTNKNLHLDRNRQVLEQGNVINLKIVPCGRRPPAPRQ